MWTWCPPSHQAEPVCHVLWLPGKLTHRRWEPEDCPLGPAARGLVSGSWSCCCLRWQQLEESRLQHPWCPLASGGACTAPSRSGGAGWAALRCLPRWNSLPATSWLFLEHTPCISLTGSPCRARSGLKGRRGAGKSPCRVAVVCTTPHTWPFFNRALAEDLHLARPESCVYTEEKSQAPGLCVLEAWGGAQASAALPAVMWP